MKIKTLSTLSIALLALLFSACGQGSNTAANNSTANTANKSSNAGAANNSNQAANSSTPAANSNGAASSNTSSAAAGDADETEMSGELQVGKTESVILYVGKETGDYAAYCFSNDSEAGRAIMAACKNGDECEVTGTMKSEKCKVPGLEADLSDSGRIMKVKSVKSHGHKK